MAQSVGSQCVHVHIRTSLAFQHGWHRERGADAKRRGNHHLSSGRPRNKRMAVCEGWQEHHCGPNIHDGVGMSRHGWAVGWIVSDGSELALDAGCSFCLFSEDATPSSWSPSSEKWYGRDERTVPNGWGDSGSNVQTRREKFEGSDATISLFHRIEQRRAMGYCSVSLPSLMQLFCTVSSAVCFFVDGKASCVCQAAYRRQRQRWTEVSTHGLIVSVDSHISDPMRGSVPSVV